VPQTRAFTAPVTVDQYWNSVVLSIPGTGTPGGVIGLADLKGHTVTEAGDAKFSATRAKFNGSSMYFGGTGDYITVAAHADLSFALVDLTIEFFVNFNTDTAGTIFALGSDQLVLQKSGTAGAFSYAIAGSGNTLTGVVLNTWYHIAFVRTGGNTWKLYRDGVLLSTFTNSTSLVASSQIRIGNNFAGNAGFNGYVQGLRITKGVGRYTGSFTPPTEPFPSAVPQGLSGVVHDSSGNPIQRKAMSYRRDTGQLIGTAISDPVTGVFSLPADSTDEHFVVVLDDVKNALVYDHIVPVI
jgi:hypothetical protein